jgi:NADH dehydrogenase
VALIPYSFDDPDALAASVEGATTLYNTYWVRFSHGKTTFESAVKNTRALLAAAKSAGIKKIVHVSIANPDKASRFPYYRGKAMLEEAVMASGLDYAIIRPTVIFGPEDILINNIAWLLRRFPIFAIAGSGEYRIQPIFVEDMAELAVRAGQEGKNVVFDAVGPEVFTFEELVRLLAGVVGSRARIVHVPPVALLAASNIIGSMVGDVILTREEIGGLMADLLVSAGSPTGTMRLSDWVQRHKDTLGAKYASEIKRHYSTGGASCKSSS